MLMNNQDRLTYYSLIVSFVVHAIAILCFGLFFDLTQYNLSLNNMLSETTVNAYLSEAYSVHHAVTAVSKNTIYSQSQVKQQSLKHTIYSHRHQPSKPVSSKQELTFKKTIKTGTHDQPSDGKAASVNPYTMENELVALLHAAISAQQQYPESALRMEREGRVRLAFILHNNGTISNLRTIRPSGTESLDAAALRAVNAAVPFKGVGKYVDRAKEYQVDVVFELTG